MFNVLKGQDVQSEIVPVSEVLRKVGKERLDEKGCRLNRSRFEAREWRTL